MNKTPIEFKSNAFKGLQGDESFNYCTVTVPVPPAAAPTITVTYTGAVTGATGQIGRGSSNDKPVQLT